MVYDCFKSKKITNEMSESKFIEGASLNQIPSVQKVSDSQKALRDMNGFFISHFFKLMYNTLDIMESDNAFSGSSGEKIFRDFLLNEYSTAMSSKFKLTDAMIERYVSNKNENSETLVDA